MSAFRTKFVPKVRIEKWFPGHMVRGLRQIQSILKRIDCVIEVHDARIPLTGRDSDYHRSLSTIRPSVLVLNKVDLFDKTYQDVVVKKLSKTTPHIIFTDCNKGKNCDKILPKVLNIVRSSERFSRSDSPDINLLVVGIPNVGKSTIINKLRSLHGSKVSKNKSPAAVAPHAGVTRHVMEKIKICENPIVYLLDTPGILEPKNVTVDAIMKMALCSTQSDKIIGTETMCDYLLYWLNKRKKFEYTEVLQIDKPTDDIYELLVKTAISNYLYSRKKLLTGEFSESPDLLKAQDLFLNAFRLGKLGKMMLDEDLLENGNEAIKQQGISKKCHYSLGSMASWIQELNVYLLLPGTATRIQNNSDIVEYSVDFNVAVILEECEMSFTTEDWTPSSVKLIGSDDQHNKSSLSTVKYSTVVAQYMSAKEKSYLRNPPCLPILSLTRIKHAQAFLDSFLFQGKDWFSSRVNLQCHKLVYVRFEILPFIDIGGTLITKFSLDQFSMSNLVRRNLTVHICVKQQRPPQYMSDTNSVSCPHSQMSMKLHFSDIQSTTSLRLIPFPRPGTWFISLQPLCTTDSHENKSHFESEEFRLNLRIRLQPCVMENEQCGGHGLCKENHFRHFYFSSCHCTDGWKGWGCTDGFSSHSHILTVFQTLLLILSNLFFLPAIYIATKCKFYAEAVVYLATMLFSSFYHACDTENIAICIFKYDVLQFCDFYSAILSFWVTIVAMSALPLSVCSMAHMAGALGIALAVQAEKTGLWTFVVPVVTGIAIMLLSWGNQCWQSKSFRLTRRLLHLIPGVAFVITGLVLFAFLETEGNYKYIHSAWHATIALSISFLIPRSSDATKATSVESSTKDAENQSAKESEMIDICEHRLNSDLTSLLSVTNETT
ncbi:transmembrane protein 8B-like protein [Leptotrombidium deliense]|uniref:Transmembrane protein 8B-like protein n=1 Tax=Leptotrombidium deliense TaxID=299467 RepID=A0A443SVM8_9ACAR|nr:transmembrane protein 8B-like protein [Leptotrombidium deliense]